MVMGLGDASYGGDGHRRRRARRGGSGEGSLL